MHPWLVDVPLHGWWPHPSSLFLLLAAVVCSWHGAHRLRALDALGWRRARFGMIVVALAPWVGGHVHFLANNWAWAARDPSVILTPWIGFHAGGAMIALAVSSALVMRHYRLPLGRVADALVPTVGIGIVLGRVGCFAEGCCFGSVCDWPWAVTYPRGTHPYELHLAQGYIDATATASAPVHPLQLYFAAVGIALVMLSARLHRRYDGQVALLALVLFSMTSAGLELLRAGDDARVYWGPLPQLLWTALAMTAVSLTALILVERNGGSSAARPHMDRVT